jgi:hypothetical protein
VDPRLQQFLTSTVKIAPWTGSGFDGTATYGADVTYRARYVGKITSMRFVSPGRENTMPSFSIYIHADDNTRISTRDRLTVDAQFAVDGSTVLKIFTVSIIEGLAGVEYIKLSCGWKYGEGNY